MKTKLFTQYHAIYTIVFLLMIVSFIPVSSHMICGGCPWDANTMHGGHLSPGANGRCEYCNTNHSNHIYEPPPPPPPTTQAECDWAMDECDEAAKSAKTACEAASITCTVGMVYPTPATQLACALLAARCAYKSAIAISKCKEADDICSRVPLKTSIGTDAVEYP